MYKLFYCSELTDDLTFQNLLKYLPHSRRQKVSHYRTTIDKNNCVISYLLLLYGLYKEFKIVDPKMRTTKYGKPYLVDYTGIYFNISHCAKGCICAVSDCEIGVDIQDIRPISVSVAKHCCCADELQLLNESANPMAEFTKIWTRKESYLKMTGTGVTVDLCSVDTTKLCDRIKTFELNDCYISVASAKSFQEEELCLI